MTLFRRYTSKATCSLNLPPTEHVFQQLITWLRYTLLSLPPPNDPLERFSVTLSFLKYAVVSGPGMQNSYFPKHTSVKPCRSSDTQTDQHIISHRIEQILVKRVKRIKCTIRSEKKQQQQQKATGFMS